MFSSELNILALFGLLIIVVVLVQVVLAIPQLGIGYMATARDEGRKLTGVAARSERCLMNSGLAMALFAPAVLILAVQDAFSGGTLLACQVFLIARVIYVVVYLAGVPWVRTGAFVVALLCNLMLYLAAL